MNSAQEELIRKKLKNAQDLSVPELFRIVPLSLWGVLIGLFLASSGGAFYLGRIYEEATNTQAQSIPETASTRPVGQILSRTFVRGDAHPIPFRTLPIGSRRSAILRAFPEGEISNRGRITTIFLPFPEDSLFEEAQYEFFNPADNADPKATRVSFLVARTFGSQADEESANTIRSTLQAALDHSEYTSLEGRDYWRDVDGLYVYFNGNRLVIEQ